MGDGDVYSSGGGGGGGGSWKLTRKLTSEQALEQIQITDHLIKHFLCKVT